MPPLARRILACVLIGLLLNATVTLACWLVQPTRFYRQSPPVTKGTPGPGEFVSSTMAIHYLMHSVEMRTAGRSLPRQDTEGWQHATTTSNWQYIYKFGFPFRNLQHRNTEEIFHSHQAPSRTRTDTSDSLPLRQRGLPTGLEPFQYQRFPIQPVFPGIVLNTAIYAAIPGLALMVRHFRGKVYRRQARCPACGYPIPDLTTCPECGQAITEPTPGHAHDESSNRGVPAPVSLRGTD